MHFFWLWISKYVCMWVTSCSRNVFFSPFIVFVKNLVLISDFLELVVCIYYFDIIYWIDFLNMKRKLQFFFFFFILSKFRLEVNEKRNDPMNENGKLADVIQLQLSIFCFCGDEWCYFSHIIHTYRFVTVQLRKFINIVPSNNKTFIYLL